LGSKSRQFAEVFRACPEKDCPLDVTVDALTTFLDFVDNTEYAEDNAYSKPGTLITLLQTAKYLNASEAWCARFDRSDGRADDVLQIEKDRGHDVLDLISDLMLDEDLNRVMTTRMGGGLWHGVMRYAWADAFEHGRLDSIRRFADSSMQSQWTSWVDCVFTDESVNGLLNITEYEYDKHEFYRNVLLEEEWVTFKNGKYMDVIASMFTQVLDSKHFPYSDQYDDVWRKMLALPNYTEWFEAVRTAWVSEKSYDDMYTWMYNTCKYVDETEKVVTLMTNHLEHDNIQMPMLKVAMKFTISGMKVVNFIDARVDVTPDEALKYKKMIIRYMRKFPDDAMPYLESVLQKVSQLGA
jgi:hypothetical protein